ncbi:MAG: hypothetical protein ACREXT_13995, partial [Gammaproteobacteria bacterium]
MIVDLNRIGSVPRDRLGSWKSLKHWIASTVLTLAATASTSPAHVFISRTERTGAYPAYPGNGWVGEAFLNLPDAAAQSLLTAENYVRNKHVQPDFTFRTPWIDFPAG